MSKVGLVFGGRSVEHKVSVQSARAVAAGLAEAGYEVVPFGIALNGSWLGPEEVAPALAGDVDLLVPVERSLESGLRPFLASGVEAVFPIVHGTWGEDGTLQGLLEMLGLPYVGAGVTASAVAMDKLLCKLLLARAGLPVVDFEAVRRAEFESGREAVLARLRRLPPPVFVKPSVGGSSVGIRRVGAADEVARAVEFALRFDDAVVVERAIVGRELECGVLGYPRLEASAVGEIVPGAEFYDYADKYLRDTAGLHAPARLDGAAEGRVRELSVAAFEAIGGSGMARVDFLLEREGELYISEINTLPGFTRISMYPRLWEISGVPLADLVRRLVEAALARHRSRGRLDAGIKDWVAELEAGG